MKKLVIALMVIILVLSVMLSIQTRGITQLNREIVTKQNTIDSLHDELFISNVTIGRYELSLDHLQEVNQPAADEFNRFLEHETE